MSLLGRKNLIFLRQQILRKDCNYQFGFVLFTNEFNSLVLSLIILIILIFNLKKVTSFHKEIIFCGILTILSFLFVSLQFYLMILLGSLILLLISLI